MEIQKPNTQENLLVPQELQEAYMPGTIKNHVPRLLKEREISVIDFMYGARIAAGTAYSWADENDPPKRIDLETLARMCGFLDVGVGDILEFNPEE